MRYIIRYSALGAHWAAALPGFIAAACIPFTILFYKYGAKIRAKCKYSSEATALMAQLMADRKEQMKADEEENAGGAGEDGGNNSTGTPAGDNEKVRSTEEAGANPPAPDNEKFASSAMAAGAVDEKAAHPDDPRHPAHPDHHEWTIYDELADRDEVDLNDDEKVRLDELHRKFSDAKVRNGSKATAVDRSHTPNRGGTAQQYMRQASASLPPMNQTPTNQIPTNQVPTTHVPLDQTWTSQPPTAETAASPAQMSRAPTNQGSPTGPPPMLAPPINVMQNH